SPHGVVTPAFRMLQHGRVSRSLFEPVEQLDGPRREVVIRDGINQPRATHEDALPEKLADARQRFQLLDSLPLRKGSKVIPNKHAVERGTGCRVQSVDLDSCNAREFIELQERPRLRKRVERLALDGYRSTSELSHSSANPPGLQDRDPMTDQEGAGRLVRRMEEHGTQIVI